MTQSDNFSDDTFSGNEVHSILNDIIYLLILFQEKEVKEEVDTLLEWSTTLDYDRWNALSILMHNCDLICEKGYLCS